MTKIRLSDFVRALLVTAMMAMAFVFVSGGAAEARGMPGAVYTLTNAVAGNAVAVFDRAANGALTPAGMYPTGGTGTGGGLGNQGALILSHNNRWLFAVNPGSDDISVFAVMHDSLALVCIEPSGGDRPISLTLRRGLLYVLNAGGAGNITGFTVGMGGLLSPLAGSTRPLSGVATGPAQVEFSPDGELLVVTEKATNLIDTYIVGNDGLASGPTTHASNGTTPFGFAFGKRGQLIVSEAFGGAAGASAMSSYDVAANGNLQVISGSAATHQTAACWVVVTNNGKYTYTSNTGSGTISGYRIGHDGSLTLLDADGITGVTGAGSSPIDMALSNNSRYLYALNAGTHTISAFRVNADGSLTPLAGAGGLPAGANGLAAR